MTCKDCLSYDVCQYHIDEETDMTVAECGHFKNKADFVEVVRCKDCGVKGSACCMAGDFPLIKEIENCFCSYGQRK